MHSWGIHLEDVKPSNIVCLYDTVYFTDFSSSRRPESSNDTSTATPAAASRLSAAPEAMHDELDNLQRHGSNTDVFSLGLVFLEMYTVYCDRSVNELHQHLFGINTVVKQYHRAIHKLKDFTTSDPMSNGVYIDCIQSMLQLERTNRPSAAEVDHAMMLRGDVSVRLNCPCHVRFKA
jgi:serine/threonine protein kinase